MTNTKYLSDETVYQAKYFQVRKIAIERNGKTFTKEFIDKAPAVFIIPYTEKNEIYLEYQYRDSLRKSIFEVIAGTVETGADPLETAKRELHEETGLVAKEWKKIATWELSVNMMAKIHVYAVKDLEEGKPHLDEDEVIETMKMPLEEALEKVLNGDIPAASHAAAIMLFHQLRLKGKL